MKLFLIALSLTGVLAGCGTRLPDLATRTGLPLQLLVAKIDCEFQEAIWFQLNERRRSGLEMWQAAYTLTLKGNETGSLKSLANTFPFTLSKLTNINLGAGGGVTTTANRTAILKFELDFNNLRQRPVCPYATAGHPFLSGSIGLQEWLDEALSGFDDSARRITSVGHTFQFTVAAGGSVSPAFVIGPAPTIGVGVSGSQDRLEDNSIDVVLSKKIPVTETVAQVIARTSAAEIAEMERIRREIGELRRRKEDTDKKVAENNLRGTMSDRRLKLDLQNIEKMPVDPGAGVTSESKRELQTLVETQREIDADLEQKKKTLTRLENTPQVTTVVKRTGSYYPADQNPNIIATQTQLTLERLNNTLRLSVP